MPDPASRSASGRSSFRYSTPVETSSAWQLDLRAVGQLDLLVVVLDAHADDLLRGQDLGPQASGLGHRAAGEVGARQAGGKAQVVVDTGRGPGLAARCLPLHHERLESLGGPVHGSGQPGRTATHDDQVVVRQRGLRAQPDLRCDLGVGRRHQRRAVGEHDQRLPGRVHAGARRELGGFLLRLGVQPAIRDLVAGEVVLDRMGEGRPAMADDADAVVRRPERGLPVAQHVLEDRVQPILRRIPGLEQVVVELDRVDRGDRDLGVCVRGQQHPLRIRVDRARLGQELDAGHAGHPLIREKQRNRGAAQLQATNDVQRGLAAVRGDDPVLRPEPAAQVALDGPQHLGVVVDRDDDRVLHVRLRSVACLVRGIDARLRRRSHPAPETSHRRSRKERPGPQVYWVIADCERQSRESRPSSRAVAPRRADRQRTADRQSSPTMPMLD